MSTTPVCQASTRPGPEATGRALCSDIRTDLGHPAPLLQGRQDTEGATQSASQHTTPPCTHERTHTCHTRTYTHANICKHAHMCKHAHARTHVHTNTRERAHSPHTHAHKHACAHTRHGHGDTAAPSWRDMAAVPAMPWAGCISRPDHRVQPGGGWKPSPGKMEKEGPPPATPLGSSDNSAPFYPQRPSAARAHLSLERTPIQNWAPGALSVRALGMRGTGCPRLNVEVCHTHTGSMGGRRTGM